MTAAAAAVLIVLLCVVSVFATESFPDNEDPVVTEVIVTDPIVYTDPEPETEIVTEAPEPETEYIEPTTEYVEPETEIVTEAPEETEEPETEYIGYIETEPAATEYFEPPTEKKTVSEKTYSTNYTAGIVSWICVAVGAVVVIAAIISTKAGERKPDRAKL